MSSSPTPETTADSAFVCDCDWLVRPACKGEAFYQEHEGKRYCVLHYPGKEKSAAFDEALKRKLDARDFNFRGVWFPDWVDFSGFEFSAEADFGSATFCAVAFFDNATFCAEANFFYATFSANVYFGYATFSAKANFYSATLSAEADFATVTFSAEAEFSRATFAEVKFNSATFSKEANFLSAKFNAEVGFPHATFSAEADFTTATFSADARFGGATFSADAYFAGATFGAETDFSTTNFNAAAYFTATTFANHVSFIGQEEQVLSEKSYLGFQFAKIAKLEHVSFRTMTLRAHWFVDVDARKFDFTNVDWDWRSINDEIDSLVNQRVSSPHRMLAIACRQLAVNAEDNHRYEEASRFRYMAMEARRLETRNGFAPWRLDWWYWLASGYGERIGKAFMVILIIMVLFAILYILTGHIKVHTWQDVLGAVNYSLSVMALQKPEPKSVAGVTPLLVTFETILGPVQAALLALAIRRKFMR